MREPVKVACVQAEPVVLDRAGTLDKLERLTAEAAREGARLVVFPETFVPAYPSSLWAKAFAGWADPRAKAAFALLARESLAVPGPDCDRLGAVLSLIAGPSRIRLGHLLDMTEGLGIDDLALSIDAGAPIQLTRRPARLEELS